MDDDTGILTISLDTELAWGTFDEGTVEKYEEAYRNTPEVIDRLCKLFEEYEITATWAIVAHLIEDCGGNHSDRAPLDLEWIDDWFSELPCTTGMDTDLWYAPWLIDRLQACETKQEIGLHGSTHMQLGADGCSRQHADEEIGAGVNTLREHGVKPKSFVFPRNDIGHVDVLRKYGIEAYRGVNARWYESMSFPGILKPPLRFADEAIQTTPPVSNLTMNDGVAEIPGSQLFHPSHGGWQYTPRNSSVIRAKKGLKKAAQTGRTFHLWFHPFNFGFDPEANLRKLESVLEFSRKLINSGDLVCLPMGERAHP